ncbi:T9SS type A sorting domain-containing protein [Flavobacterium sp. EDS]|uniref:T9SS type A sorting domain-containing protein n=1 Tax=Flavobacterium sp. EDS TaxID=2897328 RepID=UPI001E61929B|nr:T9SS type A sorting domain-containing protein [Flavobacterium sp. EDS]MCD0473368.1 T9SS type A sorting domain-containing protein [Flavobacterium sp. EDS]
MKKKYFYYILLLLFNTSILFGQKVTLTPLVVNGRSYTSGPINLESTSTSSVSLNVKVESPTATGNDGTINIYYYKASALGASIATGGNGGSLIFGGGKIANRQFVISLNWNEFATFGGSIYAEYKNATGIIYKSASIAIIKNATSGGGTLTPPADAPNPAKIANTICCDQIVRLGDKPQTITASQYANPYANYSYGINESWSANGNSTIKFLNFKSIALNIDYISELKNFTITRSLGYNNTSNLTNKSNTITITVVPSPILTNLIQTNTPVNSDGFAEISSLKGIAFYKFTSKVNLNILQNPFHVNQRGDNIVDVDSDKWEYAKIDKDYNPYAPKYWIPITESQLNNFNPSQFSETEDAYYVVRCIAIYKNITKVSNELKIMTRGIRHDNTICCDQDLKISSKTQIESPNTIIGSTPIFEYSHIQQEPLAYSTSYQWQSQSDARRLGEWTNIIGATSKDYLPLPLKVIESSRRGLTTESNYNYRRIATFYYTAFVNGRWTPGKESCHSNEISLIGSSNNFYTLKIYPNPTSSILNIESSNDLTNAKISIINTLGIVVNSNNYSLVNPNLATIDVSNLLIGAYFITIDYGRSLVQKTFIKN